MGVHDHIRAYNGVAGFLNKNEDKIDLGKPKNNSYRQRDIHLNNILIKFGEENDIKMEPNNKPSYKGSYSPVLSNSSRVQEVWPTFRSWILTNYKKQTNEEN